MLRLIVITAFLCACASSQARPTPVAAKPDGLIVPGKRVGPVAIGASGADLLTILGRPTRSGGYFQATWGQLNVGFRGDPQWVYSIITADSGDRTAEGLHVGSVPLEVHGRLGKNDAYKQFGNSDHYAECYETGITFLYTTENGNTTVSSIQITPPDTCGNL